MAWMPATTMVWHGPSDHFAVVTMDEKYQTWTTIDYRGTMPEIQREIDLRGAIVFANDVQARKLVQCAQCPHRKVTYKDTVPPCGHILHLQTAPLYKIQPALTEQHLRILDQSRLSM